MEPATEIKDIARNCRWAFEELVYDVETVEWNRQCNRGTKGLFDYLKSKHGTGRAVLAVLKQLLSRAGKRVPEEKNEQEQLKWIVREYAGVLDDAIEQVLEEETVSLLQQHVGELYKFLVAEYGSAKDVLKALRVVVRYGRPLKTHVLRLHLYGADE